MLDDGKSIDSTYMNQTLRLAQKSQEKDEIPVGALLVQKGEIISSSGNWRQKEQSPLGHAEIAVIEEASRILKTWRLENTTLYISMEPCLMCTGLIYAARIPRVVFGCKNPKGGSLLYMEQHRKELNLNHSVEITGGVLEEECAVLLKKFFQTKRKK